MIILTEKPSVAKDFASALGCSYSPKEKCYKSSDGKTTIANCVGHLFNLAEPAAYNPSFNSWKNLPVIPEKFIYEPSECLKDVAKNVVSLLKNNRTDEILIATDADREEDWLIGMNATRYVSNMTNGRGVLAVGRVQTAILSEITRRCKEISSFKREKYYEAEDFS